MSKKTFEIPNKERLTSIPKVQAKLEIASSEDKEEQEANSMADKVMMMPDSEEHREEGKMQMTPTDKAISLNPKKEGEDSNKIQMQPTSQSSGNTRQISSDPTANTLPHTTSQGNTLDKKVGKELGNKMGDDFSDVKIHADQKANKLSQQLGARAFTKGKDIYFNKGQYDPHSGKGKHLLAHELTHVIQQKKLSTSENKVQLQTDKEEPIFMGKPLSYWKRKMAFSGMPARVRKHIDVPTTYTGKKPLTATIRFDGIDVQFNDGGHIYINRSHKTLNMYELVKAEKQRRATAKAREKWHQTLLRWFSPKSSALGQAQYSANWELSDRLWIIQKLADGWTLDQIMNKKKILDAQNLQIIIISASVIPIISGSALMPGAAAPKAPVRTGAPVRGTAARALKRKGLTGMAAKSTAGNTLLRKQGMAELAKARSRGGPVVVNIGGKGEAKGAINVNPNVSSVEKNPKWPNWINAGGEDLAQVFPAGSVDKVMSSKLPGGMNWTAIVKAAKTVLKPKGVVELNQLGPVQPIVDALRKAGFSNIKVIGNSLVTAVK